MYLDERSNTLLKEVIGNPEISNARLEKSINCPGDKLAIVLTKSMIG